MLTSFIFMSGCFKQFQKSLKIFRPLCQCGIYLPTDHFPERLPLRIFIPSRPFSIGLLFNNGKTMFYTDNIAYTLERQTGQMKINKFSLAVQCSGIKNNVVMDMRPVRMGSNDESMLSFGKSLCRLISHTVRLLRRYLSGAERLANLVSNHIILLMPRGYMLVLPFAQQKFLIYRHGITLIGSYQFSLLGLFRIGCIIRSLLQTLRQSLTLVNVQCHQLGSCYGVPSFHSISAQTNGRKPRKIFCRKLICLNIISEDLHSITSIVSQTYFYNHAYCRKGALTVPYLPIENKMLPMHLAARLFLSVDKIL